MSLSELKLKSLKPRETDYKISDGEALYAYITTKGSILWRMNYRFEGKQKTLAIGKWPVVTLLDARRRRDAAKRMIADGMDPALVKQEDKEEQRAREATGVDDSATFKARGDHWFKLNESAWVPSYSIRLRNRLLDDVYPHLGEKPISEITAQDVLRVARLVEDRGAIEMARRIHDMIKNICALAVVEDYITINPARDTSIGLAPSGPVKHRTALKASELPNLMEKLNSDIGGLDSLPALGVKLIMHTMLRTDELRFAVWDELEGLDSDKPVWRIPPHRMKIKGNKEQPRGDHIVPLTPQSLRIIEQVRKINGDSVYLFRSTQTKAEKPFSENAMLYHLYKCGYHKKATIHGFRSTASTVLNEHEFNPDWIEMQLAHIDASVRGVYNAALYLRQRRDMLLWWSNFLEPMAAPVIDDHDDIYDLL